MSIPSWRTATAISGSAHDGGVSMYDGESFTHFTEKEGLRVILSDPSWRTVVEISGSVQGGGVSMYNGETFTHFTQKEGLSDNKVNSILEDRHGKIWFGTEWRRCKYI